MQPLHGNRVLAGPYCTMVPGDFGAGMIKAETPEGYETRGLPNLLNNTNPLIYKL